MLVTAFKLINVVFFLLVLRFCVNNWWKRAKTLKITIIGNISHENMLATLLLTSLLITLTNGESRLTTSNYKAVNFAREIRGRRLNGSVIKEIEVDSESSCRLQCVEETSCLSYNFGPGEDKKMFKCQLSNSDRFTGLNNFIEDPQVLYRGIKVGNLPQFAIFFPFQRGHNIWLKERRRCLYRAFGNGNGKEIQFENNCRKFLIIVWFWKTKI